MLEYHPHDIPYIDRHGHKVIVSSIDHHVRRYFDDDDIANIRQYYLTHSIKDTARQFDMNFRTMSALVKKHNMEHSPEYSEELKTRCLRSIDYYKVAEVTRNRILNETPEQRQYRTMRMKQAKKI